MKKIILFALLVLASFQLSAQNTEGALGTGVYIRPQIGFNAASMTGLSDLDAKMRLGVNVGIAAEFMVSPSFSIEPGLYYSMQGAKIKKGSSSISGTATAKLDYINIPIYAKAYVYQGLFFFAGPQFGFNTNAKLGGEVNVLGINWKDDVADLKDYVNTFDFSIGLGAGYQDPSGFMISLNYNIGLTDIVKDDISSVDTDLVPYIGDSKNGVLQVNVGFRF